MLGLKMKETVLDVLMFLIQSYMDGEQEDEGEPDRDQLTLELLNAGFPQDEINNAFVWLDGLAAQHEQMIDRAPAPQSTRLYHEAESERLDLDCQGFLIYLEQTGVITATVRELIIDRVMALDEDDIDIERLKWVTLMVLFNQPEQEYTFEWIENMVFEQEAEYLH